MSQNMTEAMQEWVTAQRAILDKLDQALEELRAHNMGPMWGEPVRTAEPDLPGLQAEVDAIRRVVRGG